MSSAEAMTTTFIDEFNALHHALVSGAIDEGEFRAAAVKRFGYTGPEISLIVRRVRKQRGMKFSYYARGEK
jgi:hypothetical protein